mmetsp:Transcript_58713/g.136998  ORF Transcript_58713/g.136998 Transcript_58713/m.136998 type:complete len:732 (-) Transcript_58713:123-2318(-)
MTSRSREDATKLVTKAVSNFNTDKYALISTKELREKLSQGQSVVLVDVRTVEEQRTSMIPGAVTQSTFEAELLPALKSISSNGGAQVPLVVPYCTVGYRSHVYCQELDEKHGISNVRNGEGVIMWTFEGGRLVRPTPTASPERAPALAPEVPRCAASVVQAGSKVAPEVWVCGNQSPESEALQGKEDGNPSVTNHVHVFAKPWDCAADGYETEIMNPAKGAFAIMKTKVRSPAGIQAALWLFTLFVFYLFFTPMCGVMYECGCQLHVSKWGQVKTCNVFDDADSIGEEVHKCPWCNCSGLSCALVAFDTRAFREIPLLDMLPDGFVLTVFTVLALKFGWKGIDRLNKRIEGRPGAVGAVKALIVVLWFFAYCLVMGVLFFIATPDYPHFLGYTREGSDNSFDPFSHLTPIPGRFLVNATVLHSMLGRWQVLDARAGNEVSAGTIPGAIVLPWQSLSLGGSAVAGQTSELRPAAELRDMLAGVGVDASQPAVVYGLWHDGWGEEGRLFWMFEYLGYDESKLYCLDGGIHAWQQEGLALGSPSAVLRSDASSSSSGSSDGWGAVEDSWRATTSVVQSFLDNPRVVLLDVREEAEFNGVASGDPYGAARSGHVPQASWWNWREHTLVQDAAGIMRLRSCEHILDTLPAFSDEVDEVIMYCTGGIRSGFVYMVLRGCGFGTTQINSPNVRNYDASWWGWAADSALPCRGSGPGCEALPSSGSGTNADNWGGGSGR